MIEAVMNPFATGALDLMIAGMAVIPLGGKEGKSPAGMVAKFNRWKRPPGRNVVERWVEEWPSANVGIVVGPSKLTVVDVDGDETLVRDATRIFGEARVVARTPNGYHLYYRSSGEGCRDLRHISMNIDIKGVGGLIVAPPSHNFLTGGAYKFVRGSLRELSSLAPMRAHSLPPTPQNVTLEPGGRNNAIFRLGLRLASSATSLEELSQHLVAANATAEVPLPISEVSKAAASAWRYHLDGRNYHGGRGTAVVPGWLQDTLSTISGGVDALWLYCYLLRKHAGRTSATRFAIVPRAFVFSQDVPFGEHRIRKAIKILTQVGALKRIRPGGRGTHDPAIYGLEGLVQGGSMRPYADISPAIDGTSK